MSLEPSILALIAQLEIAKVKAQFDKTAAWESVRKIINKYIELRAFLFPEGCDDLFDQLRLTLQAEDEPFAEKLRQVLIDLENYEEAQNLRICITQKRQIYLEEKAQLLNSKQDGACAEKVIANRYQFVQPLRRGFVAETFLARDLKLPNQPCCVVKQFKPKDTDYETLQLVRRLFGQEALTLQNIGKHEQIPSLLAYFEEDEEFYLVQEFIEGHDLDEELIAGQTWKEEDVIKLLKDILEVLAFVHEKNIIHRDLKPSNIRKRKSDDKIVLIDFGSVKQICTQQSISSDMTTYTAAVRTEGYTPSEQAQGKPKLSSDIYAIGIIAIQALTGLLVSEIQEDPKIGELNWRSKTNISSSLSSLINKMVRYKWTDRYPSAQEALQALKSCKSLAQEQEEERKRQQELQARRQREEQARKEAEARKFQYCCICRKVTERHDPDGNAICLQCGGIDWSTLAGM